MAKITIIGAGGYSFPLRMVIDILSYPELQDAEICLMDISAANVKRVYGMASRLVKAKKLPARVWWTTDLARALDGTDYSIITWQVGGLASYEPDVEIPRRYGLDQCVGDSHGPGGVFRFLRSWPAYMKVARTVQRVCPESLIINYANPMAMNCWGLNETRVKAVGLCHSVQGSSQLLAQQAGVPYDECTFTCFGINHQAWFTEFKHRGRDIYPLIRRTMFKNFPSPVAAGSKGRLRVARGDAGSKLAFDHGNIYHQEYVRTEIMRVFGYFHSESSHHGSEYAAWFRKNPRLVKAYIARRWDYLEYCRKMNKPGLQEGWFKKVLESPLKASQEYGAQIINSMETGVKRVVYGNVPNYGPPGAARTAPAAHLIPNLPQDCCVELACLVDRNGIQPTSPGPLPAQCAGMNLQHIAVQRLAIEAAQTGDPAKVVQAIALDPLTGALLTLPQIREMTRELFAAHKKVLPWKFKL